MQIAKSIAQARRYRRSARTGVVLVPTMGALHKGHRWLIEAAKQAGVGRVWVSIFVNPTQFGPNEDFDRYPRPIEQDLEICRQAGVDTVFCPTVAEMYPPELLGCEVTVPALAEDLEGRHRPGHFEGVCRVVAKLFHLVEPTAACFGQKDYQQLKIIQAMVADLCMGVSIFAVPTVREDDGLAVSSRNAYLDAQQRRHAVGLYKALCEAKMLVEQDGESDPRVVESAMGQAMLAYHVGVDYAAVRHPQTLGVLDCIEPRPAGGAVALVAGRVGGVRLIDNMVLGVVERSASRCCPSAA